MCSNMEPLPLPDRIQKLDEPVVLSPDIVKLHAAMINTLYGPIPDSCLDSDADWCRLYLQASHWSSVLGMRAHLSGKHAAALKRPGRRELCQAIRSRDAGALVAAFQQCREDGLGEIQEDWDALCRVFRVN